ncbi:AAA family ATPase [Staphylospora marina]|uniref:AAA family ATPase n=1 Tax=Staphylospora marina TaxID=2490858 RepID=UPI000F5C0E08|nr:AAA family ATPase [Staphylospora marina]
MAHTKRDHGRIEREKEPELCRVGKKLAEILKDRRTAEWAFGMYKETAGRLGITSAADERFAVTMRSDLARIHFNFCSWLTVGIGRREDGQMTVRLPLIRGKLGEFADKPEIREDYVHKSDSEVGSYSFQMADFHAFRDEILALFDLTLKRMVRRFSGVTRSPYRRRHQELLGRALFDRAIRDELLACAFEGKRPVSGRNVRALADETGFRPEELELWLNALERKGQLIFYGPPGTGKSWLAEKLAEWVAGKNGLVKRLQFHPGFSYEDFIQGIRPVSGGDGKPVYRLEPGHFLRFCREAEAKSGKAVLIIDEINRAAPAGVFGELLLALERREEEIPLAAGGVIRVPGNVRIIGTMNTADRAVALMDHAIRRRFAFVRVNPRFDVLERYHRLRGNRIRGLVQVLEEINRQIAEPDMELGTSFFFTPDLSGELEGIWRTEVEPYLEELFAGNPEVWETWRWDRVKGRLRS